MKCLRHGPWSRGVVRVPVAERNGCSHLLCCCIPDGRCRLCAVPILVWCRPWVLVVGWLKSTALRGMSFAAAIRAAYLFPRALILPVPRLPTRPTGVVCVVSSASWASASPSAAASPGSSSPVTGVSFWPRCLSGCCSLLWWFIPCGLLCHHVHTSRRCRLWQIDLPLV